MQNAERAWFCGVAPGSFCNPFDGQRTILAENCGSRRGTTLALWAAWAATSGGAHLEEAEAAASRAHFVTLARGALRELREANYWIRLIHKTELPGWSGAPALIGESGELVAIVTTIVKRAAAKLKKGRKPGA